ncbi:hypothetical protein [Plebeiibacterium marinum]|uniref:Novel STAND NTPase 3 domain-containing protein n=1 Tax=Plebeiibacterium marinum TaxID=2992111 RepID=A0AAE3SK06_9BACT|nr:hypothetical protein [Plebeiobacterium marinum]MCW3806122.1 hypothetical protein [Plebeiobacterium marinum]
MNKKDIEKSIAALCNQNKIQISELPRFTFGTKEECTHLITEIMQKVDKTITNFSFLPEYNEVAEYLSDTKGKGLFLVGSVGRGKSIIAKKVIPVLFHLKQNKIVSVYDALKLGKQMDEAERKKFIVIDDVGTESIYNNYGSKSESFADLITMAEHNSSIVFITTNLTSQQFLDRYGERILNRIDKLCRIVKFEGKSFRR